MNDMLDDRLSLGQEAMDRAVGDQGRAILIVGMHRSGTSALAGVLKLLGFAVPGDLIPPAFDNPKGFFENRNFVSFDDELLTELGVSYDEAIRIPSDVLERASSKDAFERLKSLVAHELGDERDVVVKDPRICRLLPFWIPAIEAGGRQVLTVHPLRDPYEVAQSLQKRNEFPLEQGLLLWLSHVLAAERDSRGKPRSFLMFDAIMANWRDSASKIGHDLGLTWNRSFDDAASEIADFLSEDLRHHRPVDREPAREGTLDFVVDRAWSALRALIVDPSDTAALSELDAVSAAIDAGEDLYRGYVHGANNLLAKRYDRIDSLEQHAAHMNHLLRQEEGQKEHWQRTSALFAQERDALRTRADDLETDRQRLSDERHRLEVAFHGSQHQLNAVLSSFSWRAGAPLRWIARRIPAPVRARLRLWLRPILRSLRQMLRERPAPATTHEPSRDALGKGSAPIVSDRHSSQHRQQAELVLRSPYFDPAYYGSQAGHELTDLEAAVHYVSTGEARGHRPSKRFDPRFYSMKYPDLAAAVPNLLSHYVQFGAAEGRVAVPAAANMEFPEASLDPSRPTVIVLAHEASRTGAPILAWNVAHRFRRTHNVITLLMAGGEFETSFVDAADVALGPVGRPACFDPNEAELVVREIVQRYPIDFAIANSVETRHFAAALTRHGVPVVALVHEFSTYYRPLGLLHELYETAARIVFPARVVHEVSRLEYEAIRKRTCDIVPQGPSVVPKLVGEAGSTAVNDPGLPSILRPSGFEDAFLVLGMGTVQQRKGVDLFVAAALAARRAAPERKFRFLWIGHGYKPKEDLNFSVYLQAQIELSGIEDCLTIIENVADLEPVYEEMDALLLTSRLDPLPNVSIDAALRGIPVVCFDGATGMSDILMQGDEARGLVVPHLDSHLAGEVVAALATDAERYARVSDELAALAARTFDMDVYVARLSALGAEAVRAQGRIVADRAAIEAEPDLFDRDFYVGEVRPDLDRAQALDHYLQATSHRAHAVAPEPYAYPRRPLPGFNPLRFEAEHPDAGPDARDPLAAFAAAGRPAGPWSHPVIRADDMQVPPPVSLKVALHGHFHYPELLPDFLDRLSANALSCDLFLTTDTDSGLAELREASVAYAKGRVDVRKVSNRGRDIAPFLTELGRETLKPYDLVGHLHGKRSLHTVGVDATYGERWREFLWQHLLGSRFPMADRIAAEFEARPDLGLVFPADPNLVGWDGTLAVAEEIAARMGLSLPLPYAFDFPNGTMFWARPAALGPLFDLDLTAADYPAEPLPKDGTLLHALERLLPFAAEKAGYGIASTLVPGSVR